MMELVIPAVIVIVITVFFVFFVFRNIVEKLNRNAKKYFVDKLQDYDEVINLKKQQIQILDKQIEERQEQKAKETTENNNILIEYRQIENSQKIKQIKKELETQEEVVLNTPNINYREEEFFNTYRSLKQKFKINDEKVIKKFLKENLNKSEQKEYETLTKFRNYFDADTTYQCLTLTPEEQFKVINSVAKKKQKEILELDNYKAENFDLIDFLGKIDNKIKQIDPTVYVYVGDKELNYDYLSEYIKTCVYKNMIEGIIISYQGKIYDYSI